MAETEGSLSYCDQRRQVSRTELWPGHAVAGRTRASQLGTYMSTRMARLTVKTELQLSCEAVARAYVSPFWWLG